MNKTKLEKGITLVALIITIIVLLILAGIAIATVQESDIIKKAQGAVDTHKEKEDEEKQKLQSYEDFIDDKIDKGVDHAAIIKILEDIFNNRITEEAEALQRLKDEGAIEEDAVSLMDGIIFEKSLFNDDYTETDPYLYLKKINTLYKYSETDSGITFSYVDSPFVYQQAKCMRITRETLEDIFLSGKELPADLIPTNISGFSEPENEKKFLDYIVNNSNGRIKSIGGIDHIAPRYSSYIISLADLLLVDENGEETILELIDENGKKTTALFGENSGHSVELNTENGIITSIDVYAGT